mmetsp:Transcript_113796/g.322268  ORF Transcript_113796/g.322268 Transcript_113796/m.322268 type:complete len:355 (-) Transcript_113796:54-1118(-)
MRSTASIKPSCTRLEACSPCPSSPSSRRTRMMSASTCQFFTDVNSVPRKTTMASFAPGDLKRRAWMFSRSSMSMCTSQSLIRGHGLMSCGLMPFDRDARISGSSTFVLRNPTLFASRLLMKPVIRVEIRSATEEDGACHADSSRSFTVTAAAQAALASPAAGCSASSPAGEARQHVEQLVILAHSGYWYGPCSLSRELQQYPRSVMVLSLRAAAMVPSPGSGHLKTKGSALPTSFRYASKLKLRTLNSPSTPDADPRTPPAVRFPRVHIRPAKEAAAAVAKNRRTNLLLRCCGCCGGSSRGRARRKDSCDAASARPCSRAAADGAEVDAGPLAAAAAAPPGWAAPSSRGQCSAS